MLNKLTLDVRRIHLNMPTYSESHPSYRHHSLQATSHFSGFSVTSLDGEEFHMWWGEGVGVTTPAIPCVSNHTFDR
jgi:hypothetical protein